MLTFNTNKMAKIYFFGGEDVKKRSSIKINREAFKDAGDNPRILLFLWTSEDKRKIEKYRKFLSKYFYDIGAKEITLAHTYDSVDEILRKLDSSDLVYLPGGLPKIFMKYAVTKNLSNLLSTYRKVIVGNSAGAMVLCKEFIITKDKDHPNTEIIPGLGLVDFSINVHYDTSKDNELKKLSIGRKIYALPENCAMKYNKDTNEFKFFGNVYLFENGNKKKLN